MKLPEKMKHTAPAETDPYGYGFVDGYNNLLEQLANAAPSTDRVAAQGGVDALPFYAGDLFWPDDDGETCATDMCGLIQDLADNEQIESGQTLRIRRAKTLPTVEVVVTIDDDGDVDYREALRATPADG